VDARKHSRPFQMAGRRAIERKKGKPLDRQERTNCNRMKQSSVDGLSKSKDTKQAWKKIRRPFPPTTKRA
jgi:hypothetical protein